MRWPLAFATAVVCVTSALAESGHWLDVPFVAQPPEGCGAASISMVMRYWRANAGDSEVTRIQQTLFSEQGRGIYASDLQRYFERHGFRAYVFEGDEQLLAHHIAQGRPLIVAFKPGASAALHYVVVAGVDPGEHVLLVNDPAQRKLLKIDMRTFEREWKATRNWTLLAVPRSSTP